MRRVHLLNEAEKNFRGLAFERLLFFRTAVVVVVCYFSLFLSLPPFLSPSRRRRRRVFYFPFYLTVKKTYENKIVNRP